MHSNRNFKDKDSWGKNQFNSSFPVALCCYMRDQGHNAMYVSVKHGISVTPIIELYRANQAHAPMTVRDYFGAELKIDYYYRHPRSYARRGVFSVDEPSPTIRGVNRPIPQGYPGHAGDAAPITTPGLRQLTTRERSRIQTFPPHWDLCGNKSDIEQIIGNAVPCALGDFIGRTMAQFDKMPHTKATPIPDSVSVFVQHEKTHKDDIRVVGLEPLDKTTKAVLFRGSTSQGVCFTPCEPMPTQQLLAVGE